MIQSSLSIVRRHVEDSSARDSARNPVAKPMYGRLPGDAESDSLRIRVRDRLAFVTGVGSGIGRAADLRLASEGAFVACVDHLAKDAGLVASEISAVGGRALPLVVDTTDEISISRGMEEAQWWVERRSAFSSPKPRAGER